MCHNAVDLNLMMKETQARVARAAEADSAADHLASAQSWGRRAWAWLVGVVTGATVLSGCAAERPIPQALIDDGVTAVTASRIYAQNCPSLQVNAVYAEERADRLYARLANEGMTERDLLRWAREAPISDMTARVNAHAASLPFDLSDQEAVCAAGQEQIAAQTEIGKHLISN